MIDRTTRQARRKPRAPRTLLAAALAAPPALADGIRLHLPLACEPRRTCFVQHYVDRDPGPGARDYACGSRTYDKHDGTDFRVRTGAEARGEAGRVLAVAPGRVLRVRSDMADGRVRGADAAEIKGVECGNGLVVAHADGWESQYCHMARDSLVVRPGDPVAAGQTLGQVGLSGMTEFPHLHLTLRQNGQVVDPFAPEGAPDTCDPAAPGRGGTLWEPKTAAALGYQSGSVLNAGFADAAVSMEDVEAATLRMPGADSGALVAYVRAIGLETGDVQSLVLTDPGGAVVAQSVQPALERPRAQSLLFVGRKRPVEGWAAGTFTARFWVERGGRVALEKTFGLAPRDR
ncbi:M23 family metallopeptidase [Methylobacterium radiodurans]|uniref:M23 family peptidase n=1 Tax=Methylobacterium radiodurans TaxID=2202828 RepID=A0A2U8VWR0_9HYPH|nr:M23 family metallopeptidase [Methylobacterium radiodurans]AWN38243.1 M23 family peptidase [Methylobacterium radiodurans]